MRKAVTMNNLPLQITALKQSKDQENSMELEAVAFFACKQEFLVAWAKPLWIKEIRRWNISKAFPSIYSCSDIFTLFRTLISRSQRSFRGGNRFPNSKAPHRAPGWPVQYTATGVSKCELRDFKKPTAAHSFWNWHYVNIRHDTAASSKCET